VTSLKAGNVVAIRGELNGEPIIIKNEDGSPLTFILEDQNGEDHELYVTVGRMGTYAMFVLPPFRVSADGDWGDSTVPVAKLPPGQEKGPREAVAKSETHARVAVPARRGRTTVG
jgi:hypothetical protein